MITNIIANWRSIYVRNSTQERSISGFENKIRVDASDGPKTQIRFVSQRKSNIPLTEYSIFSAKQIQILKKKDLLHAP